MSRYLFLITLIALMASCSSNKEQEKKSAMKAASTETYQTTSVQEAGVNSSVTLPAQLAAYEEVSIFPKVNGYVKTVSVDIGSHVSKGQLLMTLEAPEMEQSTMQAKEKYMETSANYAVSKERYRRLLVAAQTAGAVSPFDVSSAKAKMEADSALTNAEKTAWQMQQTTQGYLQVTAPFNGVITQRNVHPGALVSAAEKGTPMLELKNISHLRLQVDVPETVSAGLDNKDSISFTTSALPGVVMKGVVSRKSMDIESRLRTERIEIDVNNADMKLSPGMYANVLMATKGSATGFAVPKSAVLTTTEGRYVFVDSGNHNFRKINVSTGNQSAEEIEVYGALQKGQKVVINPDDALADEAE
ncbi:MAG: efflux RND transporter periplasmic adaptor subunit [Williamsia sp.]|nr:efflux RND transporter periplasmic adaptor subunit [Williamsia sp.]